MKIINNNIEEQKVNFTNAKLLKEKEFGVNCSMVYDFDGKIDEGGFREGGGGWRARTFNYNKTLNYACSAPTQQVAIDWILENFYIHIKLDRDEDMWKCELYTINSGNRHIPTGYKNYNTPEEAKESAINHVLTCM